MVTPVHFAPISPKIDLFKAFCNDVNNIKNDRDLATLFCIQEKFLLSAHWLIEGTFLHNLGWSGRGFWLCNIASLVMYFIDASLRIVTKSLYGTAQPFSILSEVRNTNMSLSWHWPPASSDNRYKSYLTSSTNTNTRTQYNPAPHFAAFKAQCFYSFRLISR